MQPARRHRLAVILSVGVAGLLSCSARQSREPYVKPALDWVKPAKLSRPGPAMEPAALIAAVAEVKKTSAALTFEQLRRLYPSGPHLEKLGYSPLSARYLDEVRAALKLEALEGEARAALERSGFVALEGRVYSYGALYDAAYHAHAPIVITTDSLLYAFHESYEQILKEIELGLGTVLLREMLVSADEALNALEIPAEMAPAKADLTTYLATARALLAGDDGDFVALVNGERPAPARVIGAMAHSIDFSLFKPRGHYNESEPLRRYFRAMQWLQQIPFRYILDSGALDRRALDATLLLSQVSDVPAVRDRWSKIDEILTAFVGPEDDFSLPDWGEHFARHRGDLAAYVAVPDAELLAAARDIEHRPRIVSGLVKGELPEVANTKQVFMMGARYAADSEVLSRVSYDRLEHPVTKKATRRMKPSEMDVQFVLGSNIALDLLANDIETYQYQGRLRELRFSLDELGGEFWRSSVYNSWLDALRSLSLPFEHPGNIPEALRTRAWDLKMLNTKLASWAELRHDNILYVKQSFSAYPVCDYPDAYLEPYPDFYERMSLLHTRLASVAGIADWPGRKKAQRFARRAADVYAALAQIAHKEVRHQPLKKSERVFLKRIIDSRYQEESVGCATIRRRVTWDGWYTELFYRDPKDAFEFDPIIADVHTSPADEAGGRLGWVLHAATGYPHAMILTIDDHRGGARAYVGPVSRFHRVETANFERLTDEKWRRTSPPAPASWQRAFLR